MLLLLGGSAESTGLLVYGRDMGGLLLWNGGLLL